MNARIASRHGTHGGKRLRHEGGWWIATLCLLLGPAGASAAEGERVPRLVDEACDIEIVDDAVAARLRCARLHVWRDPADPEAGRFEIAVAIRRSAAPKSGAAPVLFLHGGPGGQFTRWIGMSGRDPAPGHDLVAFDMRGGGRSTPRVCDQSSGALIGAFMHRDGPAAAAAERRRIADDCRAEFAAAGLSATHFGTDRNVADAEVLREALGVEQWLLFGESYGTTVAAHYVASHPERIAAAVLDSLYPADDFVLPAAEMQGRLLDRLAADCARDAGCATRWPDLGRAQLDATVGALDAVPLPIGSDDERRMLDGLALRQLLMVVGSFESGVRSLPLLIDAAARRDAAMLAGPVGLITAGGNAGGNVAAMAATDCRDRPRHHRLTGLGDPLAVMAGLPNEICRDWATPTAAPRWPTGTDVPMLVLAGGYDSFQPPTSAVVATLGPAVQMIEIAHAAHGARGAGACVRDLIGAFLADPHQTLDTGCVAEMRPPPFLTEVSPLPRPTRLAPALESGSAPPTSALVAIVAATLGLIAALVAAWGRWRRASTAAPSTPAGAFGWSVAAALAGLAGIGGPLALVATTDPMMSAALLYGLPSGWGWLPWLGLLPASVGALALWLGGAWPPRIAGITAIVVAVATAVGGWSVFG